MEFVAETVKAVKLSKKDREALRRTFKIAYRISMECGTLTPTGTLCELYRACDWEGEGTFYVPEELNAEVFD